MYYDDLTLIQFVLKYLRFFEISERTLKFHKCFVYHEKAVHNGILLYYALFSILKSDAIFVTSFI